MQTLLTINEDDMFNSGTKGYYKSIPHCGLPQLSNDDVNKETAIFCFYKK